MLELLNLPTPWSIAGSPKRFLPLRSLRRPEYFQPTDTRSYRLVGRSVKPWMQQPANTIHNQHGSSRRECSFSSDPRQGSLLNSGIEEMFVRKVSCDDSQAQPLATLSKSRARQERTIPGPSDGLGSPMVRETSCEGERPKGYDEAFGNGCPLFASHSIAHKAIPHSEVSRAGRYS